MAIRLKKGFMWRQVAMRTLAQAMGSEYRDCEIRCGEIGVSIGNCWAKKPKIVAEKMLFLVNSGCGVENAEEILLDAKDSGNYHMFERIDE